MCRAYLCVTQISDKTLKTQPIQSTAKHFTNLKVLPTEQTQDEKAYKISKLCIQPDLHPEQKSQAQP